VTGPVLDDDQERSASEYTLMAASTAMFSTMLGVGL
jgi:hypothetical protein